MNTFHSTTVEPSNKIKPWDGSSIRASLFLRTILEHSLKNGYFTLLLQGFYVSRNTIIVASPSTVTSVKQFYTDPEEFPLPTDIFNPPNPPLAANVPIACQVSRLSPLTTGAFTWCHQSSS